MGADVVCCSTQPDERPLVSRIHKSRGSFGPLKKEPIAPGAEDEVKPIKLFHGWSCGLDLNPVILHVALIESYFRICGLEPCVVEIDSLTHIHCWVPSRAPSWHTSLWCGARQRETKSKRQPVLLLHGFGGSAIWQWMHQVRDLTAAGYDVYMPDLIFFGGSWSASTERSEKFQAECMAKLMSLFGVSEFHVNGISYGGFVAYRLATMYPKRVKSLVLTNSGVLITADEMRDMLSRWQVADTGELLLPQDSTGVQRLMNLAYHRPPKPPQWLLKKTIPVLFENMVEEKRELLAHLDVVVFGGTETFPNPEIDTLLVWGRHDSVFPLSIAERMQSVFGSGTELVVLENASHVSNAEQGGEYNIAILGFLKRIARKSGIATPAAGSLDGEGRSFHQP